MFAGRRIVVAMLVVLAGCQHLPSSSPLSPPSVVSEPPQADVLILVDELKTGIKALPGKTKTILVFDRPDSILMRAKVVTDPPDLVREDLRRLQQDRVDSFNEALVTACDGCADVEVSAPSEALPLRLASSLIDRAVHRQEPTVREIRDLRKEFPGFSALWVIFGALDDETELAHLRSFIFDAKTLRLLHASEVKTWYESPPAPEVDRLAPLTNRAFLQLTELMAP